MKTVIMIIVSLIISANAFVISGYNTCYVRLDVGFDNMNFSNIGVHIDSSYNYSQQIVDTRNIFENGYIKHTDWDGGMNYFMRNDSVLWDTPTNYVFGFIFNNEKMIRKFGPSRAVIEYEIDSVVSNDTVGSNDELYRTKGIFTKDSLYIYSYDFVSKSYNAIDKCFASENSCECWNEKYEYIGKYIEKVYNGAPYYRYYISEGVQSSARLSRTTEHKKIKVENTMYLLNGRRISNSKMN